ncbi:MAG: hypothetical protein LQ346_007833 [Caloplaca aetnensis]|nr:MAG: hypothetical protein LQ346_007833 [Caloplaca aetnensis]
MPKQSAASIAKKNRASVAQHYAARPTVRSQDIRTTKVRFGHFSYPIKRPNCEKTWWLNGKMFDRIADAGNEFTDFQRQIERRLTVQTGLEESAGADDWAKQMAALAKKTEELLGEFRKLEVKYIEKLEEIHDDP